MESPDILGLVSAETALKVLDTFFKHKILVGAITWLWFCLLGFLLGQSPKWRDYWAS